MSALGAGSKVGSPSLGSLCRAVPDPRDPSSGSRPHSARDLLQRRVPTFSSGILDRTKLARSWVDGHL